jgi:arylsulfatase A-like enzyme
MREITRRGFVGALAAPAILRAAATRQPNIVFILSDDVGIDLMGCYGSDRFKTPHIDALAASGIRFETCHSTPLCGPTRCEFNTGRYAFRTGGLTNQSWNAAGGQGAKSSDEFPVARLLKQAGYATCASGKWRQVGETPGDWGFDEWLTDPTAGGWFWEKSYTQNGKLVERDQEVYGPDVAHEFAMDFVRRNRKGPFFLYYSTHLVHAPIVRTSESAVSSQDFYADMLAYLDHSVGKVAAEIDRLGLRKNTVIVFSGDNGTARESGTIGGRQINGAKGSMWEGGSRVPLIASWPGTTPAGRVSKDMVDFSDFHATFAELAGATLPASLTFDGRSFAPQLRGQRGHPREWIFVQLGRNWYVKEKGWKLNQKGDLYDMKEAPFEEKLAPAGAGGPDAEAGRKRLQGVLDKLNPAGGKTEPDRPNIGKAEKQARKALRQKKKAGK